MFFKHCGMVVLAGVAFLLATPPTLGFEGSAEARFYRAHYLETVAEDWSGAAKLYEQVADDRGVSDDMRAQATVHLAACREELASTDFARLMPETSLGYIEINNPGKQLERLLSQLGLLKNINDKQSAKPGETKIAVSPVLIRELLGIRGAAIAVTGFNPAKGEPMGVAVLHPGRLEVIRGILETGLPAGGTVVEPIGGFSTFNVEGEVFITLTSRLIVASPSREEIKGVIRRLAGKESSSLASNQAMASALEGRDDSLFFLCINAKPIMSMANVMMMAGGGAKPEIAVARALLDPNSLESLVGKGGVSDDGVSFDLAVQLDKDHNNLVYNFLRLPPLSRETLRGIPRGAAGFAAVSLNEPSSYRSSMESNGKPVITAMDVGREFLANIQSMAFFALAPEAGSNSQIPDGGAVITVNDPSKSQALWTQILGIASLATGQGAIEGQATRVDGVEVKAFRFPEKITVHVAMLDNQLIVTTTESAMSRSLRAGKSKQSVLDDPTFAAGLNRIGDDTTKALFINPGRVAQIAKKFAPPSEMAEIEQFIPLLSDTMVSLVLDHSDNTFHIGANVTGIPNVGPMIASLLAAEKEQEAANKLVNSAIRSKNWDKALIAIDTVLATQPARLGLLSNKFKILALHKKDRDAALLAGEDFFEMAATNATSLNNLAWSALTDERFKGEYGEFALHLAERANELTKHSNWRFLDTLAHAKHAVGDSDEAVALEKKAIELADGKGMPDLADALKRFAAGTEQEKLARNGQPTAGG